MQKRIGGSPPFQIGTPSAVIAVRGTRFYVEVDKQKVTEVDVEDGVVEVENAKGIGTPILIKSRVFRRVKEDSSSEAPQPTEQLKRQLRAPDRQGNPGNRENGPTPNPSAGPSTNSLRLEAARTMKVASMECCKLRGCFWIDTVVHQNAPDDLWPCLDLAAQSGSA